MRIKTEGQTPEPTKHMEGLQGPVVYQEQIPVDEKEKQISSMKQAIAEFKEVKPSLDKTFSDYISNKLSNFIKTHGIGGKALVGFGGVASAVSTFVIMIPTVLVGIIPFFICLPTLWVLKEKSTALESEKLNKLEAQITEMKKAGTVNDETYKAWIKELKVAFNQKIGDGSMIFVDSLMIAGLPVVIPIVLSQECFEAIETKYK